MEVLTMGFIGVMTIGVINVVGFFKPDLDSRIKIALSIAVAFGLTFVPADISNLLLAKITLALEVTAFATGGYKLAQKIGGK